MLKFVWYIVGGSLKFYWYGYIGMDFLWVIYLDNFKLCFRKFREYFFYKDVKKFISDEKFYMVVVVYRMKLMVEDVVIKNCK